MSSQTRLFYLFTLLLACSTSTPLVSAAPIVFTHEGSGSGTLGGIAFADAEFIVTATADTNNRLILGGGIFAIEHASASISISGLGDYDFTVPTRTFINDDLVGFSRSNNGGQGGSDLFNGPTEPELLPYELLTSIGPVSGLANLLQWSSSPEVVTTGGVLEFASETQIPATFTAELIPEPTSVFLLVIGALVMPRRNR